MKVIVKLAIVISLLLSVLMPATASQIAYASTGITVTSVSANIGDMYSTPTFTLTGTNLPVLTDSLQTGYGNDYQNIAIVEPSTGYIIGSTGNISSFGIYVLSSSSTQLVFRIGSNYNPNSGYGSHYTGIIDFYLSPANTNVQISSSNLVGSINLSTVMPSMTVTSISANSSDMYNNPTFTLIGTNLPTLTGALGGSFGTDYQNFDMIQAATGYSDGNSSGDTVGINVVSSSSTKLVFTMASNYGPDGYGTHYTGVIDFYLATANTNISLNSSTFVGSIDLSAVSSGLSGSGAVSQIQTLDPSQTDPQVNYADPVNTATGAHEITLTPLTIYGEQPLSLQLQYNSLLLNKGPLGNGWGSNFETSLAVQSNGNIIVHWNANRQNTFVLNSGGQFVGQDPSVHYDTLVKNADGSFTLTTRDQSVYQFNSSGQLIEQGDGHGQWYTFAYENSGPLQSVTEPISGAKFQFNYNANGLIESVSDSVYRQVYFSYDSNNNLVDITDPNGNRTSYSYDSNGRILSATDAAGITLFTDTYDSQGRVISQSDAISGHLPTTFNYDQSSIPGSLITTVTDRNGQKRVFTYNSNYNLTSEKDPLGNTTYYAYDPNGNRNEVTNANGYTSSFGYDANGNLTFTKDTNGNVSYMSYDSHNNLLTVTNSSGKTTSYTYDSNNNKTSMTDVLGNTTTYSYDSNGLPQTKTTPLSGITSYAYQNGLLQSITDPDGVLTSYSYDGAGRPKSVTQNGQITQYTYDANGNILSKADGLGNTTTYTYDCHNQMLTRKDPNGNETQYTYDNNGNLVTETNPLNQKIQYQYDGEDRLIGVTDANGNTTTFNRDADGRIVSVVDPLGNKVTTQYDALGNTIGTQDALGNQISTISYDAMNNPLTVKDALGNTTTYQYDGLYRLTQTTDPLGHSTQFTYDNMNRMVSATDALGGNSRQAFDANGNNTSVVDPNNNETDFTYDKAGRLTQVKNSSGNIISYQYNSNGQLAAETNGRGQTTSFHYDAAGRLVSFTDPTGTVSYTYDKNGNQLTAGDSVGTVSRQYDALNRLVNYTDVYGNVIQYAYDNAGNLTTLTYPDGKTVRYTYDSANRMTSVTDWNGNPTLYSYDANGRLIKTTRPDGSIETRTYNAAVELTQLSDTAKDGTIIDQYNYTYDPATNISSEQSVTGAAYSSSQTVTSVTYATYNYTNNGLNELTGVSGTISGQPMGQDSYTYDATGNVLNSQVASLASNNSMTYTTDNRLATFDGAPVTYDADGNMTNGPLGSNLNAAFQYDARNRLTSAGSLTYTYDATNTRVAVTQNGVTTRYVVNPNALLSQVLMTTDSHGTPTMYYVYGLGLISQTDANGQTLFYHDDRRGSTVALTNMAGEVTDTFSYSPYGALISHAGSTSTPFLFNGRDGVMTDANGLYYMRARYYNPQILRFINADVKEGNIQQGSTLNRYAYVNGQPLSYVDPFGLSRDGDQTLNYVMTGFTVLGLIPGLNIPANAVMGIISAYNGDLAGAGLDFLGMIPGVSDFINGSKLLRLGTRLLSDESGFIRLGVEGTGDVVQQGEHTVYTLRDPISNDVKYVGRTKNPIAREAAHKANNEKAGLVFTPEYSGLSKQQARGLEQILFENNGGLSNLINRINPISPKNDNISTYLNAARDYLGTH